MDQLRPSPDQVERFRSDVTGFGLGGRFGVAVSGGPDSLALLLLAAAAFPGTVEAVTVDHGLRVESADEAAFVAQICQALGVPHAIVRARVDSTRSSLQRAAREARYAAIDAWMAGRSLNVVATAHHVDDQAETLLMRLLRGSGVGGLAGVRDRSRLPVHGSNRLVIRPLLGWRREALRTIVDTAGIVPIDDPSNRNPRFDRVRIRQQLSETGWLDPDALAVSAAAVAEAEDALGWTTDRLWDERVERVHDKVRFDPTDVPAELRRRIVLRIIDTLREESPAPRGEEVGRILDSLAHGGTATLAGVQANGGPVWLFGRAPPRRGRR